MKRIAVLAGSLITLIGLGVITEGAAVAAGTSSSSAVINFDDAAHQVQLIIPTPACPTTQPTCQWKFFLNEPKLSVDVATIYGTSGTLTLAYPKNFCGVIQADAYVGPPWVAKRGWQHTIADCTSSSTPTTTTTTTTGTAASPTTSTTTTTTVPPVFGSVAAASAPPPTTPPDASPASAAAAGAAAVSAAASSSAVSPITNAPASSRPAQLPFTGVSVRPLLITGSVLVVLGLCLLSTTQTRRRMARRLLARARSH